MRQSEPCLHYLNKKGMKLLKINNIGLYSDEGAEKEGIIAFRNFFAHYNINYVELTSEDVNRGIVFSDEIDMLWIPGGWAVPYNEKITDSGMQNIRDFVCKGNKLLGTCAGQYFISEKIIWEGVKYPYKLNIFKGTISGSLHEIAPWKKYIDTIINLNTVHPVNKGMPNNLIMVYYGGGEILPDPQQPVSWIGYFDTTGTGAVATIKYGNGTVMLMGPHAELGISSDGSLDTSGGTYAQWEWLFNVVQWMSGE